MKFSYSDVERALRDAMAREGLSPAAGVELYLDDTKHRYQLEGDKRGTKNGEYAVYMDERPAGYFKSYKGDVYVRWSFADGAAGFASPEERAAWIKEQEEARAARAQKRAEDTARAVELARKKWEASTTLPSPMHGYTLKKGLRCSPAARLLKVQDSECLVLPYQNERGELTTIQTISSDGTKRFQKDAPQMGTFCVLSPDLYLTDGTARDNRVFARLPKGGERVFICEGWATGVSIFEAYDKKLCVVVAANCGNLERTLQAVMSVNPRLRYVFAADNDNTHGNAGLSKALELREKYSLPVVFPPFDDKAKSVGLSDWNDYACKYGIDETRRVIDRQLQEQAAACERYKTPRWVDVHENKDGTLKPLATIANLEALLDFLGVRVFYDEIAKREVVDVPFEDFSKDLSNNAALAYIISSCNKYGLPNKNVPEFITKIAAENYVNPVAEWIMSKPWDGRSRMSEVVACVEAEPQFPISFKNTLFRKWFCSAIAALFFADSGKDRHFKCEGTLVLQGAQGIGKTTFFRELAALPEWFGDGYSIDPSDRDSVKSALSRWIVELGELQSTFKKADLDRLKAFLTKEVDVLRMPYARREDEYERRTVFCGTVNQKAILMDDTGNRRFWCVPVQRINLERLHEIDMQQFWAEVYETVYSASYGCGKDAWWLSADERVTLEEQNKAFRAPDVVEDLILSRLDWSSSRSAWRERTVSEILMEVGLTRPQRGEAIKAGRVLKDKTGAESRHTNYGRVFLAPDVTYEWKMERQYGR